MAKLTEKSKDKKIKSEISRLRGIFKNLEENKRKVVESLIKTAAFMAVSLEELQALINEKGYTEEYQNGENQSGVKQSEEVKTHIAMTKNYTSVIKLLVELVPASKKKDGKLEALRNK